MLKHITWTSGPNDDGWKDRHRHAIATHPVAKAIGLWYDYARGHLFRYGSEIGEDYALGLAWAEWGLALRGLLNGDMGECDCGTLDTIIVHNLVDQGFDVNGERL